MKVYAVTVADYDSSEIVAVYPTRELANEHVRLMDEGYVEECEVREGLHPDATDPKKQAKREADAAKCRAERKRRDERSAADAKSWAERRPSPPHMGLCHCQTFSERPGRFWNAHGYCSYCGGFAPEVFRDHMGEGALQVHIGKLAERERVKMGAIVSRQGHSPNGGDTK